MSEQWNVDPATLIKVALIDSYEPKTIEAVQEELKSRGIACYIEGSIVYPVSVSREDATRAREVLRDSKRINHKRVQIIEDGDDSAKN